MKYKTLLTLILTASTLNTFGVNKDSTNTLNFKSILNLGFWSPITTNSNESEHYTNNISLNLLYGNSKNINGLIVSGLFSNIGNKGKGISISGLYNRSKTFNGIQIGVSNYASSLNGIQIGFVNGSESGNGIQIGAANTLKSEGIQIGLVNIAENNDYPIGLINIIRDGEKSINLSLDETMNSIISFRSGGTYLYGIVGLGYNFNSSHNHFAFEAGIGNHLYLSTRFRINNEISLIQLGRGFVSFERNEEKRKEKEKNFDYKNATKISLRILPEFKINKRISVLGGPSINYMLTHDSDNKELFPSNHLWRNFSDTSLKQIHIGYSVSLQYFFK